jgi:DNA-binding NarL/FixJ family response regulator
MRYVTVVMHPVDEVFHPVSKQLEEATDLTREAIHAVEQLENGTVVMLTEVGGNLDNYRSIMADAPGVLGFTVSGDESGYCYVHIEPTPPIEHLIERQQTGEFVVEFPVEITKDGGHRVTMVGREEDFANAPSIPPAGVEMELVSMGPYHPEVERVFSGLTDRQQEVLETAIRLGYYETPREATHDDIAEQVGVEPSTVGKHLRHVESRVFSEYVL